MSAYLGERGHIAALVETVLHGATDAEKPWANRHDGGFSWWWQAGRTRRYAAEIGADALGQMLLDANLASLHARYPDTIGHDERLPGRLDEPASEPYRHPRTARRLTIAQTFKAVSGYAYQACEHGEWYESDAKAFVDGLRDHLGTKLPGYHEASWEIGS